MFNDDDDDLYHPVFETGNASEFMSSPPHERSRNYTYKRCKKRPASSCAPGFVDLTLDSDDDQTEIPQTQAPHGSTPPPPPTENTQPPQPENTQAPPHETTAPPSPPQPTQT